MEHKEQIESLISQMTLDEKIGMIHGAGLFRTKGVERLGIPPLKMSDGPMGVRCEFENDKWMPNGGESDYVSYLPSNSAIASTWNTSLAYQAGQVLGAEARGRGKDVILAPGINIKRSPLNGRNFEYMSEDPYLTSELVVPMVKGIQENDVAACVKHFALNNQETQRIGIDVEVSERALREIYLPGFYAAVVRAGTYSMMCAYNRYLGKFAGHSHRLLNEILTEEWGFSGIVISDWGAIHDTKEAALVNMDIEMSVTDNFDEYYLANPLKKEIQENNMDIKYVDDRVRRILHVMDKLHMLWEEERKPGSYNIPYHRETIYETAAESIVLLKNEDHILPLNQKKLHKLLVVGENASHIHANGGGSAEIKALYEISPLLGLYGRLGGNCEITYAQGYQIEEVEKKEENWQAESLEAGGAPSIKVKELQSDDTRLHEEAIRLAKEHDDILFIGGLNHTYDLEGGDRKDMKLPYGQDELINSLLDVNPNTIIVMCAGSPVDMSEWADRAKGIIFNWYAGCEGGHALADVLLGNRNPSGHLPETFARKLEDYPSHSIGDFPGKDGTVHYLEGNKVGYRHFDTADIAPLFPFGHGLSYTEFKFSHMECIHRGNEVVIRCRVKNIGTCFGKVAIQLYVSPDSEEYGQPKQELRRFEKIALDTLEYQDICFELCHKDFTYFSEDENDFVTAEGEYEIRLGCSSRDIRLTQKITIQ